MYHLIKKTRYFSQWLVKNLKCWKSVFSLVKLVRVGLGSDVFTQSCDFLVLI